MAKRISCGVIVTDGDRLLLGHATRSPRWDIPKGQSEPGESLVGAAVRELGPLGVHVYLRDKDLALFVWMRTEMPPIDTLVCRSTFALPGGAIVPEFDRFGVFTWNEALGKVGKNMARVLGQVGRPGTCAAPFPQPPPARGGGG
jgi:hypothetical protein